MAEIVEWRNAVPLWGKALEDTDPGLRLRRPQLLRSDSDDFMEELLDLLDSNPANIAGWSLRVEDWQGLGAGWESREEEEAAGIPKLYQPVHQRFYLLAASLVCRKPGLPDHQVRLADGESVSFVLRRLTASNAAQAIDPLSLQTFTEEAWVPGTEGGTWSKTTDGEDLLEAEELLPMFHMAYKDGAQPRRLWAALVPTSRREVTDAAAGAVDDQGNPPGTDEYDPRMDWYDSRVGRPLDDFLDNLDKDAEGFGGEEMKSKRIEITRFWLLDLAELLRDYACAVRVWGSCEQTGDPNAEAACVHTPDFVTDWPEETPTKELYEQIAEQAFDIPGEEPDSVSLLQALCEIYSVRGQMLENGVPDNPDFGAYDLADAGDPSETLRSAFKDYFAASTDDPIPLPDVPDPPKAAALEPADSETGPGNAMYVLRCVYRRPQCAGSDALLISRPSRAFRFSHFFDPDAPARPIHIAMPADTGIAHLRRFRRGVSMTLSKSLRNQLERFRGIKPSDLEDFKLAPEGQSTFGLVCSFSIPIITLCALILLIIMIQLLNMVFWWLPYLKICFPSFRKT